MVSQKTRLSLAALGGAAFVSSLAAFAATTPAPVPGGNATPGFSAAPAPPAKLPPPPAPGIVARVNGQDVTREELVTLLMKRYGSAALEQLIDQKILEQAAQKQNITASSQDLELQYQSYKLSNGPQIESLENQYGKDYLLQNLIKPGVLVKKIGETLVKVDPADLDEVKASHILIAFDPAPATDAAAQAKSKEDAKKLADQVFAEAKKPGADFAALAKKYSKDPGSAAQGGDLGYFGRGRMVPPFEDAAFKAKPGEIVGPVETTYGYHIIKVVDRRDVSKLSPVEREQKREQLIMSKAREPIQAWVSRQKTEAKVERYSLDDTKTASR